MPTELTGMIEIREARLEDAPQLAAIGSCVWVDTYAIEGMRKSIAQFVINMKRSGMALKSVGMSIGTQRVTRYR